MINARCICKGKGYYLVKPEMLGYFRSPALDRTHKPADIIRQEMIRDPVTGRRRKAKGKAVRLEQPRRQISTAYRNKAGSIYQFSIDETPAFGARCETHNPLFEIDAIWDEAA